MHSPRGFGDAAVLGQGKKGLELAECDVHSFWPMLSSIIFDFALCILVRTIAGLFL
jgi:hypothetical protein